MKLQEISETKNLKLDENGATASMRFRFLQTSGKTVWPTLNNRIYGEKIVDEAIQKISGKLAAGQVYGSSNHPRKGDSLELDQVSHILTKIERVGDDVYAEAKILPTTKGKNLMAIIKAGGSLGVSARGKGETKKSADGKYDEVANYELEGVDFVVNPSTPNFVSKANLFESQALTEEQEDIALRRYENLVRSTGFRGSFADYKKIYAKVLSEKTEAVVEEEKPKPPMDIESLIETRWRMSCRAGAMMTKADYRTKFFPETLNPILRPAALAAKKKLDENRELTEPAEDFHSISGRQDYLFLIDCVQEGCDALFGPGEYTCVDVSDDAAIIASKSGELCLQKYHRTMFGDQEISLHDEPQKIQEAKWKVKGTHPTKPGRELTVRAKHAKQAAAIATDEFAKSGHSVSSVQFVSDDTDPSGDQTQSPGSGN